MKNLALAALAVFASASFIYVVLTAAGVEKAAALPIAAMPLNGIVFVHQTLEKGSLRPNFRALPRGVVDFQGFALPWYQLLVYGTLIFAALKQIGGFIGGVAAGLARVASMDALAAIAGIVGNLVGIIAIYAICAWIGTRCAKYTYLVGLGVPFLGNAIGGAVDFTFLSNAEFVSFFGAPKSAGFFLIQVLLGTLLVAPFAMLGIWRGRRARLSAYLSYLLGLLPASTRSSIIDLAYEEVKVLTAGTQRAAPVADPLAS